MKPSLLADQDGKKWVMRRWEDYGRFYRLLSRSCALPPCRSASAPLPRTCVAPMHTLLWFAVCTRSGNSSHTSFRGCGCRRVLWCHPSRTREPHLCPQRWSLASWRQGAASLSEERCCMGGMVDARRRMKLPELVSAMCNDFGSSAMSRPTAWATWPWTWRYGGGCWWRVSSGGLGCMVDVRLREALLTSDAWSLVSNELVKFVKNSLEKKP